jgi:hypothetical protein
MTETQVVAHLEGLRVDSRDEIKRRIEGRDRYSIQLTISLAAIIGVAFSRPEFLRVLIAAPLVAIYYTVLILYSYRVHRIIATYLREKIEPRLADVHGIPIDLEWENFYYRQAVPGIRVSFFLSALWIVTVLPLTYLILVEQDRSLFVLLCIVATIYVMSCGVITRYFWV